jgi:hypothetical protein
MLLCFHFIACKLAAMLAFAGSGDIETMSTKINNSKPITVVFEQDGEVLGRQEIPAKVFKTRKQGWYAPIRGFPVGEQSYNGQVMLYA